MQGTYTILIIAHRLSTVIGADKIFLVRDGKIACVGSHDYLLKTNEEYKYYNDDKYSVTLNGKEIKNKKIYEIIRRRP